jgi:hypothetical protein
VRGFCFERVAGVDLPPPTSLAEVLLFTRPNSSYGVSRLPLGCFLPGVEVVRARENKLGIESRGFQLVRNGREDGGEVLRCSVEENR